MLEEYFSSGDVAEVAHSLAEQVNAAADRNGFDTMLFNVIGIAVGILSGLCRLRSYNCVTLM